MADVSLFSSPLASRLAQGPLQTPTKIVLADLPPGVKLPLREAYHSVMSGAEVNNGVAIPALSLTS